MKKYVILAFTLLAFPFAVTLATASDDPTQTKAEFSHEEAVKNVEDFYMSLQNNMNESHYDKALTMIDQHFADDFLHYDDGEVSYGKDGMIMFVENNKNLKVRTHMDINIIDTSYLPEKKEVLTKFNISQKFFKFDENGEEFEDKDARINLTCSDSLRIHSPEEFQLYKCDCIRQSANTQKEAKAEIEEQTEAAE